jgi:hypothetical protein
MTGRAPFPTIRPRRFWYVVAAGLPLACLAAVIGFGLLTTGLSVPQIHLQGASTSGASDSGTGMLEKTVTVRLAAGEHQTIYFNERNDDEGINPGSVGPFCGNRDTGDDGGAHLRPGAEDAVTGGNWVAVVEVWADQAGAYDIDCSTDVDGQWGVGNDPGQHIDGFAAVRSVGGLGLIGSGVLVFLVMAVVTTIGRSRARRRLARQADGHVG